MKYLLPATIIFMCFVGGWHGLSGFAAAYETDKLADKTYIENKVNVSAGTGGNSSSDGGLVETGDAGARAKVEVSAPEGKDSEIKVDVRAQANDQEVTVEREIAPGESVTVSEQAEGNGNSADIEVDVSQSAENADTAHTDAGTAQTDMDEAAEKEGIIKRVVSAIASVFEKIFGIF